MAKDTRSKQEIFKDRQRDAMLQHAAGIGAGWFALTLLARQLIDISSQPTNTKFDKKLKAYANARYPVISMDPSLRDGKREKKERRLGVEDVLGLPELESKTASAKNKEDKGVLHATLSRFVNPFPVKDKLTPGSAAGTLINPALHPAHIALTLAALAAGVGGGWAVSNSLSTKRRGKELDTRIADTRNRLDKLMYQEYERTRNKEAAEKDRRTVMEKGLSATGRAYVLYSVMAMVTAAVLAKSFADKADPARQRMESLQNYAKDRATTRGSAVQFQDLGTYKDKGRTADRATREAHREATSSFNPDEQLMRRVSQFQF